MDLKKLNTLFHSTKKVSFLKSIIKNGFATSYASEKIGDRNVLIAMISFSNVPLLESRSQVDYGKYSIGLKRSWGIKNKLHPVTYTYKNSVKEFILSRLIQDFALFQVAPELSTLKIDTTLFFENFSSSYVNLYESILKSGNAKEIEKYFSEIFSDISDLQLYFKHYININKKGKTVYCFNDREWRYVPNTVPKLIFETDASGKNKNDDYLKFTTMKKPHLIEFNLDFDLTDIEFIMVKKNSEIQGVINVLNRKFKKEDVQNAIMSGELSLFSFEKIHNSI